MMRALVFHGSRSELLWEADSQGNGFSPARCRLDLSTEWVSSSEVRVVAVGEIDLSNVELFTEYVFRAACQCLSMVIDLRGVTFFACAGFSALCEVENRCRTANIRWMVEPGRMVSRTLEICDPFNALVPRPPVEV
jgi:anti-anti-sigma factor